MYTNMGFSGIFSLGPKGNFEGKNNYRVTVPESTFMQKKLNTTSETSVSYSHSLVKINRWTTTIKYLSL